MIHWQLAAALLCVAAAACVLARRLLRWGRGRKSSCGGCHSCSSSESDASMVQIGERQE